ncbi:MAG: glycosyltransferase family 4 protein [Tannerellaceae bacterium]|nr:glycosyltransferase family 4 protein [Tannerellaceae bacterium]
MRILLLNQIPEVNNKYTFSLARALLRQNVDIVVCGIEDDNVSAYADVPYFAGFRSYSKEKGYLRKVLSYQKSWERIVQYCKDEKMDIVHVQWYIFSPLDWMYHQKLRKMGIRIVTTIHDLLPFNKRFYDFYFHKKIYSHADKVINQARSNEQILQKDFAVPAGRVSYIPHGHYMDYVENATREESRELLKISQDRPVVLFFGQIKKVKGVDVLIRAMREVKVQYNDVLLLIAGKVWKDDYSIYQKLIEELGLQDTVRSDIKFIPDEEIKYYFNAADIVALPYLQIYQSGVVLLAYAYEKPIVATSEGEFLTVVKDRETGLLVNAGNSRELAEAICYYLDDMEKANEMARKGKADLSVRLSWDSIAGQVKALYEECLQG